MSTTTSKKFDEFVERQSADNPDTHLDWVAKKQEWLKKLELFFDQIESFLKPYIDQQKITLQFGKKEIWEEFIGQYQAKVAWITLGKQQIRLEPIGTNLIGAKGRVDMIGPCGKVKFVLVGSTASAPKISVKVKINEEAGESELASAWPETSR